MRDKMLIAAAEAKLVKQATKKRKAEAGDAPIKRSKPKADDSDTPSSKAQLQPMMNPTISSVARKVTEQLAEEEAKRKAGMSDAVKSLYAPKNGPKKKETFMTMGTFTRYA